MDDASSAYWSQMNQSVSTTKSNSPSLLSSVSRSRSLSQQEQVTDDTISIPSLDSTTAKITSLPRRSSDSYALNQINTNIPFPPLFQNSTHSFEALSIPAPAPISSTSTSASNANTLSTALQIDGAAQPDTTATNTASHTNPTPIPSPCSSTTSSNAQNRSSAVKPSIRGRRPRIWSSDRNTDVDTSKMFVCPEPDCMKMFGRNEHLTRHLRVHSGERPFACTEPGCSKRFTRSDNLVTHLKSHQKKAAKKAAASESGKDTQPSTTLTPVSSTWSPSMTSSTSAAAMTLAAVTTVDKHPAPCSITPVKVETPKIVKPKRSVKAKSGAKQEKQAKKENPLQHHPVVQPMNMNTPQSAHTSPSLYGNAIASIMNESTSHRKLSTASLPASSFSGNIIACSPMASGPTSTGVVESRPALTDTPPFSSRQSPAQGASPRSSLSLAAPTPNFLGNNPSFSQHNASEAMIALSTYTQQLATNQTRGVTNPSPSMNNLRRPSGSPSHELAAGRNLHPPSNVVQASLDGLSLLKTAAVSNGTDLFSNRNVPSSSHVNMTSMQIPLMHSYSGYPYEHVHQLPFQSMSSTVHSSHSGQPQVPSHYGQFGSTGSVQPSQQQIPQQNQNQQTAHDFFHTQFFMPVPSHSNQQMQQAVAAAFAQSTSSSSSSTTTNALNLMYNHNNTSFPTQQASSKSVYSVPSPASPAPSSQFRPA